MPAREGRHDGCQARARAHRCPLPQENHPSLQGTICGVNCPIPLSLRPRTLR